MIQSINPYNGELLATHPEFSDKEIDHALQQADDAFRHWKDVPGHERARMILKVADVLENHKKEFAETMTREMGKPLAQAIAEIEKCSWLCEYYAEHGEGQLAPETVDTEAIESYVRFEPLGVILAVMPWNFPFWQVFRFAIPALMAGNTAVLKHASNVMGCARHLENIFHQAGFPEGCFQHLVISSKKVAGVIRDERIKAVTLTGSEKAGSAVAEMAGSQIKKTVLELGGSNALVVFEDADLEKTVAVCVQARFQNTGQSCIAGKRLLVHQHIVEEFLELYTRAVRELKSGDPMEMDTYIGVLAREDLARDLEDQVRRSVEQGGRVVLGGTRKEAYYAPTILTGITPEMPVFCEETFGPVIGISTFNTEQEAIALANATHFGLGVSLFTSDLERAKKLVPEFEDGAVFVNELVKSDPRLPFGGTKRSGYGRELAQQGIREFVNVKTVYFKYF